MDRKIIDVDFTAQQKEFLINCPAKVDPSNPLPPAAKKWLPDPAWGAILNLIGIEGFEGIGPGIAKE